MPKSISAIVTPEVLVWSRNLDRITPDEVASRMKITTEKLAAWEAGSARPTLRQAKDLAKFYRVPFVYFYLPDVPQKTKRIEQVDYRTFGNLGALMEMSRELRWTLRDIEDRRDTMLELYDLEGRDVPLFAPYKISSEEPEKIASHLRKLLNITYETQLKFRKPEAMLNYCVSRLEELGVLVFQAAKVEPIEMRGASLGYDEFPIVLLNRKDEASARLFTLIHELAHLVLGLSSVCNDISEKSTSNNKTELLCNNIAGLALVPAIRFKQHPDIDAVRKFGLDDSHVRSIARDFAVSKEVILHRLWSEGIIEKQLYFDTLKRYNEEYLQYQAKKPKGFLPPVLDKGTQIGKLYARTVLTSYHTQSISTRDASNFLLNLSAHHFAKMEGWCFK